MEIEKQIFKWRKRALKKRQECKKESRERILSVEVKVAEETEITTQSKQSTAKFQLQLTGYRLLWSCRVH